MALSPEAQRQADQQSLQNLERLLGEPGHSPTEIAQWQSDAAQLRTSLGAADTPQSRIAQLLASGLTSQDIINRIRHNLSVRVLGQNVSKYQPENTPAPTTPTAVRTPVAPAQIVQGLGAAPAPTPLAPAYAQAAPVGGAANFGARMEPTTRLQSLGRDALSLTYGMLNLAGINVPAMKGLQPGSGPWDFTDQGEQISAMSPEQQQEIRGIPQETIDSLGLPPLTPEQARSQARLRNAQTNLGPPIDPVMLMLTASGGGLANSMRKAGLDTAGAILADEGVSHLLENSPLARKLVMPLIARGIPSTSAALGGVTPLAAGAAVERIGQTGDLVEGLHAAADTYEAVLQIEAVIQGTGLALRIPGAVLKPIVDKLERGVGDYYSTRLGQTRQPNAFEYQQMMKNSGYVAGDIVKEADAAALAEFKKRLKFNLDILSDHLTPGVKTVLQATQERIKDATGIPVAGEIHPGAATAKRLYKALSAGAERARVVGAEGTLQPGGKPFVYQPGASPVETAVAQEAAQAAEAQVVERAKTKAEAEAAFANVKNARPRKAASEAPTGPQQVGRFNLVPAEGGKVQIIDRVSGQRVSSPMDAATAQQAATLIDSGKVKVAGLPAAPEAPTPETPLVNPVLTKEQRLARMKAQNEARLRAQALAKADEAAATPEPAPNPDAFKSSEQRAQAAFDEMMTTRPPAPRGEYIDFNKGVASAPRAPRTGPVVDIATARGMLDAAGFNITPTSGLKGVTGYEVVSKDGGVKFQTTTLAGALVKAGELVRAQGPKAYSLLAGEIANQTLFADSPDDDEETRAHKLMWRNAIRLGTMGALVGAVVNRTPGDTMWRNTRGLARTFFSGLPESLPKSPAWKAAMEAAWSIRKGLASLSIFRSTPEVVRNLGDTAKLGVARISNASRAFKRDLFSYMFDVNKTFARMGVKSESPMGNLAAETTGFGKSAIDASHKVFDVLEGVHSRILSKMPPGATKESWLKAIDTSLRRFPDDITPEAADAARAAVKSLSPDGLRVAARSAGILKDLRNRATIAYFNKFLKDEGAKKPYAVFDKTNEFIQRFDSEADANTFASKQKGATVKLQVAPSPAEMDAALGTTIGAYAPHLIYDSLANKMHVNHVIMNTPWHDPQVFINEVNRILDLSEADRHAEVAKLWGKEIGLDARGQMNTKAYKAFVTNLRDVMAKVNVSGAERIFQIAGIPKNIYVRFFKERLKDAPYSRDAIAALRAYVPATLRYVHLQPLLPDATAAMNDVAAQVQAGRLTPATLANVTDFFDTALQRKRGYAPELGRAIGKVSNMAYGAALFLSAKPAIDNFIGQVLQVGVPELGGVKSIAALIALADKDVRSVLAKHDLIRNSMPIGEETPWHQLKSVRAAVESGNPTAVVGALKDAAGTMGNFIGTFSEPPIRLWAMVGGLLDYMEKTRQTLQNAPGLNIGKADSALKMLKVVSEHSDKLPDDYWERAMLHSEDTVNKVAYFFEEESLPPFLRMVKRVPGGGFFTMFTNFPVNYGNRLVSDVADAFNTSLPAATRRHAQATLVRRIGMTYLLAGPLAFPIIQEFTDEVSDKDAGVGGALRRFLMPFHNFWLEHLGRIYGGQDMSRYGFLEPITEAFTGRRFEQAPVVAAAKDVGDLWSGMLGELPAQDLREAKQRFFGGLTDDLTHDTPNPESNMVPELALRFMPGGRALNTWMNYYIENRNQDMGLNGILDPQHRGKVAGYSPMLRVLFGQSYADRVERNDAKWAGKVQAQIEQKTQDVVNALVSPTASDKERKRAWVQFSSGAVPLTPPTIAMIEKAQANLTTSPAVRAVSGMSADALNTLAASGIMERTVANLDALTPEERQRRLNIYLAYLAARAKRAAEATGTGQ